MSTQQLSLGDCDPTWGNPADLGAEELEDPVDREWWDLRGQRITKRQYHRIQTVKIRGDYL